MGVEGISLAHAHRNLPPPREVSPDDMELHPQQSLSSDGKHHLKIEGKSSSATRIDHRSRILSTLDTSERALFILITLHPSETLTKLHIRSNILSGDQGSHSQPSRSRWTPETSSTLQQWDAKDPSTKEGKFDCP